MKKSVLVYEKEKSPAVTAGPESERNTNDMKVFNCNNKFYLLNLSVKKKIPASGGREIPKTIPAMINPPANVKSVNV